MAVPVFERWLDGEDPTCSRDEAVWLVLNQVPPAAYAEQQKRPTREHEMAHEWLRMNVPEEWVFPPPGAPSDWELPRFRLADIVAAVERQRPPHAFGQELLDAWTRLNPAAPRAEVRESQIDASRFEQRLAVLNELLRDTPEARDPPCPGFTSVKDYHTELRERAPELFTIEASSFLTHFWKKQTLVRFK